jgi:Xaa-Pro aminopeptidase
MAELEVKLGRVREALAAHGLAGLRLRGLDWFAWATCGGSAAVLLAAESGIAEVLVTREGAWVLTDVIEAPRLREEELPAGLELFAEPWQEPQRRERFVQERCGGGRVASDRPAEGEAALPASLWEARSTLLPEELTRYRALGRESAEAMTEVLQSARAEWTGFQLAGAASEALWGRGIQPLLTLVGDADRLPRHRHPTASGKRLGERAMLVFCARRHGLFANLTRFVYFRPPSAEERRLTADVARVEAAALRASRPGATLGGVYDALVQAYREAGHPGGEAFHHQGGTCGYLARDVVARPGSAVRLQEGGAVAWNPTLPGAKVEDTVVVSARGHEVLTVDPRWPTVEFEGLRRPEPLVR